MRWRCALFAGILACGYVPVMAQTLESVLSSYSGTAEQNAFLWRNLEDLRYAGGVPPHVEAGLNQYRVQTVRAAREQVVRDMLASGKYPPKDLAGFINTGTWSDPSKFKLGSDVDFTAVGRNPQAVEEFKQRFYQNMGQRTGVQPSQVIRKLDVNCYTMGGIEPGAYRTPGGQRFFEVYSARTGGYEAITGSGANATVRPSHIDNAFIDLGRPLPKFTPRDSAGFVGELRSQLQQNSQTYRGNPLSEAKKNAKLVERTAYANAVAEGKTFQLAGSSSQLVRESAALRSGKSLEQALAGRVDTLVRGGMTRKAALEAASRQFVNESRSYVNTSAARLSEAALKSEGANASKFQGFLNQISGGKLGALLKGADGAITSYMLYSAYQDGGKAGLAKELVAQGLYRAVPATMLAELAGMAVEAGGQAILDYANDCKSDAVLKSMFGSDPKQMLAFYQKYHDPVKLREFVDKEWKEQYQYGGLYYGQATDPSMVGDLVYDKARDMMLNITTALREQRNAEQAALRKLQDQVRAEQAKKDAKNDDRDLDAEEAEARQQEIAEIQAKENATLAAARAAQTAVASSARRRRKPAGKEEDKSKGGAESDDQPEPQATATVAPNLIRTNWSGQITLQSTEVGPGQSSPAIVLPLQMSVDNYNHVTVSFSMISFAEGAPSTITKPASGQGRYDSRNGTFEVPFQQQQRGPQIAVMLGIPCFSAAELNGGLTGTADSDSAIRGDIEFEPSAYMAPSRPVSEEEIAADANKLFPNNPELRAEHVRDMRALFFSPEKKSFGKVRGTWRAARAK